MAHAGTPTASGASYLRSYFNDPPRTAKNVCGQAAIAAMLDFHQVHRLTVERTEYDDADGRIHWPNSEAINAVWAHYPPDCLFGFAGTSPGRIVEALRSWGLSAEGLQPGDELGRQQLWQRVEDHVGSGLPVITIVNRSKVVARHDPATLINRLRNRLPMAHWAIVHKVDDLHAYVANVHQGRPREPTRVSKGCYRGAMDEWWMDLLGFRHYAILVAPKD